MQFKKANVYAIAMDSWMFEKDNAANWVLANNFKAGEIVDDEGAHLFIQRAKGDFKLKAFGRDEQFVPVNVAPGVIAMIGELEDAAKSVKAADRFEIKAGGLKIDTDRRLITGPVLIPFEVDLQGDWELPEDIEDAAHRFMANPNRKVGIQHAKFGDFADIVESWLLREPMYVETVKGARWFPKGSWFMTYFVKSDPAWRDVKDGKIDGFSIGYTGTREEV